MTDRRREWIAQMAEASRDALTFTDGMTWEAFDADLRTQRAVVMCLMIVGEVAARLASSDPDYVARHPEVPRRGMRGMRKRIAHGYFEIDLAVVWRTLRDELPDLVETLRRLD